MAESKRCVSDREDIYDELIAPLLERAMKVAEAHGMAFVAQVEYELGEFGLTVHIPKDASFAMRLMSRAAVAYRNMDSFLFWIVREAREHGHTSAVLAVLLTALDGKDGVRRG